MVRRRRSPSCPVRARECQATGPAAAEPVAGAGPCRPRPDIRASSRTMTDSGRFGVLNAVLSVDNLGDAVTPPAIRGHRRMARRPRFVLSGVGSGPRGRSPTSCAGHRDCVAAVSPRSPPNATTSPPSSTDRAGSSPGRVGTPAAPSAARSRPIGISTPSWSPASRPTTPG